MPFAAGPNDPDRFVNFGTPGSQEWWYFDAISADGRDALVVVWYAGLPFDPAYGVAAIRHAANPARHPAPHPLDHCAIGLSWYRDGKTLAYALNAFRRDRFALDADPFAIDLAGNTLRRDAGGYHLRVRTPAVDGKSRITAELTFRPVAGTTPLERDWGHAGAPHHWMLAAPDCGVVGTVEVAGRRPQALRFEGRGYHDHNAGAEEMSLAMRRWSWGRVHAGPLTHIYYQAQPRRGTPGGVWLTCRDGRPEVVRDAPAFRGDEPDFASFGRAGNVFGLRHGRQIEVSDPAGSLCDARDGCVDDGPFYRRWVTRMTLAGAARPGPAAVAASDPSPGISEYLDGDRLNRPLFNWMIPFRLKRPAGP